VGMFCIVAVGGWWLLTVSVGSFLDFGAFAPLSLVLPGIALFVLTEGLRKHRAAKQHALLWLLMVSAERSMPLAPAIEAFARERGGRFGRRAKRVADMLNSGAALPDALARYPKLLPRHALPMVRVGYESGTLGSALRQAATLQIIDEPVWMALVGKVSYLTLLPIFGLSVLAFVMMKIVPAYEKIFKDFGLRLPPVTQWLISAAYFLVNYWFLFGIVFFFVGALVLCAVLRYYGWIGWDLPVLAPLVRRLHAANILDSLALVAGRQRPMVDGVADLAAAYPKGDIRRRLGRAAEDIRAGRDWCESLQRCGLLRRADLAILQAAQRVGNLSWAMQEMAQSGRRRLAYRLQAIAQAVFPAIVICLGLMVMFIVVSLFMPLVALILKLA